MGGRQKGKKDRNAGGKKTERKNAEEEIRQKEWKEIMIQTNKQEY